MSTQLSRRSERPRFYKVKQVARTLGVSDKSARRLLERGLIQSIRVGKCVRVSSDALEAFIAKGGHQ
jgi:excisionase family DNA binding protein